MSCSNRRSERILTYGGFRSESVNQAFAVVAVAVFVFEHGILADVGIAVHAKVPACGIQHAVTCGQFIRWDSQGKSALIILTALLVSPTLATDFAFGAF